MKASLTSVILAITVSIVVVVAGGCSKTVTQTSSTSSPTAPKSSSSSAPASPKPSTTAAASEWDKWKASYDAEINNLVAGSKKEGSKVVVYAGRETDPYAVETIKYFKSKWGIDVEFVGLGAGEAASRIKAEVAANKVTGDYQQSGSSLARRMAIDGFYQNYVPPAALEPGVKWGVDPLVDSKSPAFSKVFSPIISIAGKGAFINTKLVPPEKEPKTYKDLLDPFWKGKISMFDPTITGDGNRYYWAMRKIYGVDFLKELAKQNIFFGRDEVTLVRHIAAGERAINLGTNLRFEDSVPGTPIKFIFVEAIPVSIIDVGIVTNTPHLSGAKLFMNYQLSKEGQQIMTKFGTREPLRADVKAEKEGLNLSGKGKMMVPDWDEDQGMTALQKESAEIFGIK